MEQQVSPNLVQSVKKFFASLGSNESDTQQEMPNSQSPKIAIDKIYFLHIRRYKEDGTIEPWGGATIAYKVSKDVPDEDEEDLNDDLDLGPDGSVYFVDIGVAHCRYGDNHKDLFCKRIGRDIATARLLDSEDGCVLGKHPTHSEVIKMIKEMYYTDRETFVPQIRVLER